MEQEKQCCGSDCCCKENKNKNCGGCDMGGVVYCLGFVGAAIYFIGQATGFWPGVLGVLKAIVWPAMLVYELLKFFAK